VQQWVFARTQLGRRLRATAQDPEMARACGVPVTAMILVTFAIGAACAGAAGLLLANRYFVTPTSGGDLILKAYIAVTVGGWGSVPGAVVGALLIALFEVGVSSVLSYPVALGALYLTLLAILVLRPQGLFGEAVRRRG
jgi:branched-chain amino acid transport system permease protein